MFFFKNGKELYNHPLNGTLFDSASSVNNGECDVVGCLTNEGIIYATAAEFNGVSVIVLIIYSPGGKEIFTLVPSDSSDLIMSLREAGFVAHALGRSGIVNVILPTGDVQVLTPTDDYDGNGYTVTDGYNTYCTRVSKKEVLDWFSENCDLPVQQRSKDKMIPVGICKICGCTWSRACVDEDGPCFWMNKEKDLCSVCEKDIKEYYDSPTGN